MNKVLELFFLSIILIFSLIIGFNYYRTYTFKHNPLSQSSLDKIDKKEQEILFNMQNNFNIKVKFPIIITDEISGKLYGLTSLKDNRITIFLNKKVMRESMSYVLKSVMAHEYAHALLFYLHKNSFSKGGHSEFWKSTCIKLGGEDCRQYVNQHEIVISKMPFIIKI